MTRLRSHPERHAVSRIGWLRAAVLGANDGLVSTASLIVGVAASGAGKAAIMVAGGAALVAGAMSMAAGEYVSVSSQSDTEKADLEREKRELSDQPEMERTELAEIYIARGLDSNLARQVADELMARDALGAHARDELGMSDVAAARPLQAAFTSALTFSAGAFLPLALVSVAPRQGLIPLIVIATLLCLAMLGALGARAGGAPLTRSLLRVSFWGALALAVTAGIGRLFGTVV
ncbi:MAG: VIT family protein [Novosphingobium aromaticivorans]|nr:VIT family protein [Novosphingobium aromaticivorans]